MGVSWQKINKENCIGRKYIDKSIFKYGIHIPLDYREGFIGNIKDKQIELGKCQHIDLIFDDYVATVELRNINSKGRSETIQVRYDGNKDFRQYLKKKFKYTDELINDDSMVDTDEYIEIYRDVELNKFHIKYNIHDNCKIKENTSEYSDLQEVVIKYDKEYIEDNSKEEELRQTFIEKFPLKYLETLELERYALGKKQDNLCWWLEYNTIPLGSIKGGNAGKFKIYFSNKENNWVYPKYFSNVEDAWIELRQSICNLIDRFEKEEYNALNDGSMVSTMNMFKTKLLYMYFPEKLLPIYSITHLQKVLTKFGYDYEDIKYWDIVQANIELKKFQHKSDMFKSWDSLKFMRFLYTYVIPENKEDIVDDDIDNDLIEDIDATIVIDRIYNYIKNQGYTYTKDQLSNLFLSLKTKPFLILAGISGTGKSKIARLLSDSLGANFNQISVKPDWNDSTDLIGYKNLKDQFIEGYLTKIIKEASQNKNKPYIICLDEMNLARVEYYLSDYLSIVESRRKTKQEIITDNIIQEPQITLHLPDNIYIIGTVNMDDTTFQFSRKVLDRANTIEFSDVDLENLFAENTEEEITPINIDNNFLKTTYLKTIDIEEEHRVFANKINKKIIQINEILKKSQKQFAYRVRDEILFYMIENEKANLLDENIAFDYQIMQKILPAINGSENSIKEILVDLLNYTCDKTIINDSDDIKIEEAKNYIPNAKYKMSAQKIIYMLKGYQNDGYVSFWC